MSCFSRSSWSAICHEWIYKWIKKKKIKQKQKKRRKSIRVTSLPPSDLWVKVKLTDFWNSVNHCDALSFSLRSELLYNAWTARRIWSVVGGAPSIDLFAWVKILTNPTNVRFDFEFVAVFIYYTHLKSIEHSTNYLYTSNMIVTRWYLL